MHRVGRYSAFVSWYVFQPENTRLLATGSGAIQAVSHTESARCCSDSKSFPHIFRISFEQTALDYRIYVLSF
jgi:hypothetical protein